MKKKSRESPLDVTVPMMKNKNVEENSEEREIDFPSYGLILGRGQIIMGLRRFIA